MSIEQTVASVLTCTGAGRMSGRVGYLTERDHNSELIVLMPTAGTLVVTLGNDDHSAVAGDIAVLPPGTRHSYVPRQEYGWAFMYAHVAGERVAEMAQLLLKNGPIIRIADHPLIRLRFETFASATRALAGDFSDLQRLRTDAACIELLAMIAMAADDAPARAASEDIQSSALISWMELNFHRSVTAGQLARAMGWSDSQLANVTERAFGVSPYTWITQFKIGEASRLLLGTTLRVSEIAKLVGFSDPLHFSRRFHDVTGSSPTQWRRLHAEQEPRREPRHRKYLRPMPRSVT